ncbi:MAG TPA: alpha/beta fold hydrolase [Candidatus Binatia bacterium]|nr:alpha/beta fold hydrolase [Candidatus Binatia bacterium]
MRLLLVCSIVFVAAAAPAQASAIAPGVYDASGQALYVGIQHHLPDPAQNDYFDPTSGRTGDLASARGLHLRCGVREERRLIAAPQGHLGASLYYRGDNPRATIVLIHGADAETREMGFIIPYFVCNGMNVVSYDQRGVGESTGNWFLTGPIQKVQDVVAAYDTFRDDRHVAPRDIGVWGFSNGGWTAPLLPLRRPVAFMILKSAPTESILSNIDYEVTMELRRHSASGSDIARALEMWHTVENAIYEKVSWNDARRVLGVDQKRPWFQYSLMPKLGVPPPAATVSGLREAFGYDPRATLMRVITPTLALYGAYDRKLDSADSSAQMREFLDRAGARDVTVIMFPQAGHTLEVSANGYDADVPERFAPGYPGIVLTWLRKRGLIDERQQ